MGTEIKFYDLPAVEVELPGYLHIGIPGPQGEKGEKGDTGAQGPQGEKGDAGAVFTPGVDDDGILSWTNDEGLENPADADLKPLLEKVVAEKLPGITEADDGKVLTVENGKYVVREPSGGVSSWNDLTDKPFYEEAGTAVILEEQELSGFSDEVVIDSCLPLVVGETYMVVWDDTEYSCTGQDASFNEAGSVILGNAVMYGFECGGEPFMLMTVPSSGITAVVAVLADGSDFDMSVDTHKVGITQDATVVKTLDEKFLPMEAIDARIEEYINAALEGDY